MEKSCCGAIVRRFVDRRVDILEDLKTLDSLKLLKLVIKELLSHHSKPDVLSHCMPICQLAIFVTFVLCKNICSCDRVIECLYKQSDMVRHYIPLLLFVI